MESSEYLKPIESMESVEINEENLPVNCLSYSSPFDYVWSFMGVIAIIVIFVLQEPEKLTHWMLFPLALCGTVVGADAIRWFKGTYTLFDPKGIIGISGINFFLIAPLLIVFYDMEGIETYIVSEWRPILGLMAVFNFFGLITYKMVEKFAFKRPSKAESTYWTLNSSRATFFVPLFVIIAFASFCIYVIRGGGLGGVILQERQGEANVGLVGAGVFMILRDALPLTVLIGLTIHRIINANSDKSRWWLVVGISILFLFFFTSGLRGSRAATGYGLICAGAILHYFWRRLTVKMVLLSLIPLLFFFYLYSFYKSAGIIGIRDLLLGRTTIGHLQEETTRTFSGMLVGDLSRAPVQAVELDVLVNKTFPYRYRYGKTYPHALGSLIPRQIWPSKPIDTARVVAGTEMLYGEGTYGEYAQFGGGGSRSTQLYGLAGEAMLNFGIYGILPAFAIWGFIVGKIRKRIYSYRAGDMRLLMSGFWLLISFIILASDADQLVWFFTSLYIIPATLIYLITDKVVLNEYYE
jgi:hypothetical protein